MSERAAVEEFRRRFGEAPEAVAVAPGRINLIGEHTDYNDGFVFPAAIDKRVYVAARVTADGPTRLVSLELGEAPPFDARTVEPGQTDGWAAYAAGMAWVLREAGHGQMPNVEAVVSGDVPIGSGVSSSAALELAFGVLWTSLADLPVPMPELALLAQRCENEFVGVKCGIMDQMASAMGREGQAMFLDTRSLDIHYAPVPPSVAVVVCDTKKPRALADSAYNERRAQCEAASRALGVSALRDATVELLVQHRAQMDEVVYRRARHVITENARCERFAEALQAGDLGTVGRLMRESHESLRDDYEVSSRELDAMAEAAWQAPGCLGARMTGAGFGGACVALVEEGEIAPFIEATLAVYKAKSGIEGDLLPCRITDGARALQQVR